VLAHVLNFQLMSEHFPLTRIRPTPALNFLTEEHSESPTSSELYPKPQSNDDKALAEINPPWRRSLFALIEQPKSSQSAFLLHTLTTCLIVFSALVTVLETVPTFHLISFRSWFGVETSIVALFTVEYIARSLAWSNTWISLLKWVTCTCSSALGAPMYSCNI
jgi:potassium voltage-gated channel Shal-related subfamily D protein 2